MLNHYNSYKKLKITPFVTGLIHLLLFGLLNLKQMVPGVKNTRKPVKKGCFCNQMFI